MKQIYYTLLLGLILPLNGNSQQFETGIESGVGSFIMEELKEFNDVVTYTIPFNTKIVEDFPMYFFYRPYIYLKIKNISFGPIYTFQSTGSRISAKDYSGEYRFDMIINSHSPGIGSEVSLIKLHNIKFSVSSAVAVMFSNLRIKEYMEVLEDVMVKEAYDFRSVNMFFEPGVKFSYPVQFLNIGINAGYLFQIGNKSFYSVDNKEAGLINPESGEPVKPGWSGFRAGLSVSFCFPHSQKVPVNY